MYGKTEFGPGIELGALLIAQGLNNYGRGSYKDFSVIVNTTYPGQFEVRVFSEPSNVLHWSGLPPIVSEEYQSWLKEACVSCFALRTDQLVSSLGEE